ncbi:MAG: OFA family MFS transporter [Candidatus Bathyarchaeia archaeon]
MTKVDIKARWTRLVSATLSMMLIGLYQYSWTIFKNPIQEALHQDIATVQLTFTISTWAMTLSQPFSGYFADKYGSLPVNIIGGMVVGLGWICSSLAQTINALYLAYGLGAAGVGAIYGTSMSTASRLFPERRGFATGVAAFGFGFGAALLNGPISWMVETLGYKAALQCFGLFMLGALTVFGFLSRYPSVGTHHENPEEEVKKGLLYRTVVHYSPKQMLRTRQWWILYVTFTLTASTGLMVTAQLADMGRFFGVSSRLVLLASEVFAITNGVGRIVGGWVSDRLGRERTMSIFFTLQGVLSIMLLRLGTFEVFFVILVAAIGFLWGPIFTFFPALTADYYGRRNSTVNYGITYTAKGWGGLLGGYVAAILSSQYGGFIAPILTSTLFNFAAALAVMPRVMSSPQTRHKQS